MRFRIVNVFVYVCVLEFSKCEIGERKIQRAHRNGRIRFYNIIRIRRFGLRSSDEYRNNGANFLFEVFSVVVPLK